MGNSCRGEHARLNSMRGTIAATNHSIAMDRHLLTEVANA